MREKPSPRVLESLVERRASLETQIAQLQAKSSEAAEEAATIVRQASPDDEKIAPQIGQLEMRQRLHTQKAEQLQGDLPALDAEITSACDALVKELWTHLKHVEAIRYDDYCDTVSGFYTRGRAGVHFQQISVTTPIGARVGFATTDAQKEVLHFRHLLDGDKHLRANKTPEFRAHELLKLVPVLPSEHFVASGVAPVQETAVKATPTSEPPRPAHWFKKKVASLLGGSEPEPAKV